MKREFLKNLGLTDEQVNQIMTEMVMILKNIARKSNQRQKS